MASRKALQTIQMATKLDLASSIENDVIKPHEANNRVISNKSKPKQLSRPALSESKENAKSKVNVKAKVNLNNWLNKKSDPITPTVTKPSKCEEIVEKRTPVSESFDELYWITSANPPEAYWKEIAEQRLGAIDEAELENSELFTKLENQAEEISRLQQLTIEVQELKKMLEDIIGPISNEFEPKQPSGTALNEREENPETTLNTKAAVSHSYRVNEKRESSENENLEKKSTSDAIHEIGSITAKTVDTPVGCWQEIAEKRRVALEKLLLVNEDLHTKVNEQDGEISRLRELTVEVERFNALLEELGL